MSATKTTKKKTNSSADRKEIDQKTNREETVKKVVAAYQEAHPDESLVGKIVTIKPSTTNFVGGNGIPESVLKSELYVSRFNSNGTVVLGDSNTLNEVGSLFPKDIELTNQVRSHNDLPFDDSKISIRIFGVPERMECIKLNQSRLGVPDDMVFIDEKHAGVIETAKRAWSYPTDKPYVLVLQDDVELCDNFMNYVNKIIEAQPDAIISLFSLQFMKRQSVTRIPKHSPYILTKVLTGQGIIMPTVMVQPCIDAWKETILGDDTNIAAWANENDIRIVTTIPVIMQHIGDKSVFSPSRSMGRSEFYRKNPSEVNWESKEVTNWTNILND